MIRYGWRDRLVNSWLLIYVISAVVYGTRGTAICGWEEPSTEVRVVFPAESVLVSNLTKKVLHQFAALYIRKPYFLFVRVHRRPPGAHRKLMVREKRAHLEDRQFGGIGQIGITQDVVPMRCYSRYFARNTQCRCFAYVKHNNRTLHRPGCGDIVRFISRRKPRTLIGSGRLNTGIESGFALIPRQHAIFGARPCSVFGLNIGILHGLPDKNIGALSTTSLTGRHVNGLPSEIALHDSDKSGYASKCDQKTIKFALKFSVLAAFFLCSCFGFSRFIDWSLENRNGFLVFIIGVVIFVAFQGLIAFAFIVI